MWKLRVFRYPLKFYSKLKTNKQFRYKFGVGFFTFMGCNYYYNTIYSRKFKGLKKLASIYRPNESDNEMVVFKNSITEVIFDDKAVPMGILYPQKLGSLIKMVLMCGKYGIGIINKDKSEIYLEQDKFIEKQFVVINQKKMKQFDIDVDEQTITIGPGWKIHSLNEKLQKYGLCIPLSQQYLHHRIFELFDEDNALLDYTVNSNCEEHIFYGQNNMYDFKNLVKKATVVLPDGKPLVTHRDKIGSGMDFSGLFMGSKGSLGILGEIQLKVVPLEASLVNKKKFYFSNKSLSEEQQQELLIPLLQQHKNILLKETDEYIKIEISENVHKNYENLQKSKSSKKLNNNNVNMENNDLIKYYAIKNQNKQNTKQQVQIFTNMFKNEFQSERNKNIIDELQNKCTEFECKPPKIQYLIQKYTGMRKFHKILHHTGNYFEDQKPFQEEEFLKISENILHLRLNRGNDQKVLGDIRQKIQEFQEENKENIDGFVYHLKYYPQSCDLFIDFMKKQPKEEEKKAIQNVILENQTQQQYIIHQQQQKQHTPALLLQQKKIKNQEDNEKKFQMYKNLTNIVVNNEGEFVKASDSKVNDYIGRLSGLQIHGMNNNQLQLNLKSFLDPNRIYLNSSIWHAYLKPQFTIFDQLFDFGK